MTGGPVPGWYPDPAGGTGLRWWDGNAWAPQPAPAPARPAPHLADEEAPARWARNLLPLAAAVQVAGSMAGRGWFHAVLRADQHIGSPTPQLFGGIGAVVQASGAVGAVTGVVFLVWFARSARNAAALGLRARRDPAAAVAGFVVPIISLWWPYQSTCDLLAEDDVAHRRLVLGWFLLWMLGGYVGAVVTLASAFVDSWVGWAMLAVPAALTTLAALAARKVVATVVDAHSSLRATVRQR